MNRQDLADHRDADSREIFTSYAVVQDDLTLPEIYEAAHSCFDDSQSEPFDGADFDEATTPALFAGAAARG